MDETWHALRVTPIREVRRRAAIVSELTFHKPTMVDAAERFAWDDNGGQSTLWHFLADGRALLLTFGPEADLSVGWDQYAAQEALYGDVPEDLVRLVRDRPASNAAGNVTDVPTGRTIHWACGVFWFDGEQWRVAEGLLDHCDRTGVDPMIGSEFVYCLDVYRFGQDFVTPEAVVADTEHGWYVDADEGDELTAVQEIFARYGDAGRPPGLGAYCDLS
ncbi:hypothetical protein [Micromonospora sp. M71_S20]|uniref:hypothetical protein n=1 Tax=Micromonospora sp. M71_S20 TaxID=592872 RepID=UPI0018F7A0E9|nr:hypothetical protein [Micromonospora sp. M71_S20]